MKTELEKTKDLVVGQMYYFDNTKDSYGKLIKKRYSIR